MAVMAIVAVKQVVMQGDVAVAIVGGIDRADSKQTDWLKSHHALH